MWLAWPPSLFIRRRHCSSVAVIVAYLVSHLGVSGQSGSMTPVEGKGLSDLGKRTDLQRNIEILLFSNLLRQELCRSEADLQVFEGLVGGCLSMALPSPITADPVDIKSTCRKLLLKLSLVPLIVDDYVVHQAVPVPKLAPARPHPTPRVMLPDDFQPFSKV